MFIGRTPFHRMFDRDAGSCYRSRTHFRIPTCTPFDAFMKRAYLLPSFILRNVRTQLAICDVTKVGEQTFWMHLHLYERRCPYGTSTILGWPLHFISFHFGKPHNSTQPVISTSNSLQHSTMDIQLVLVDEASHRQALTWISRSIGIASMAGSFYVIYRILSSSSSCRHRRLYLTFDRLLFSLCICDILSSLGYLLGDWPVPQQRSNNPPSSSVVEGVLGPEDIDTFYDHLFPNARGNQATCNMQGFLFQVGTVGSVLFVGCIAIQYVLVVKYRLSRRQLRRWEIGFFAFGWSLPLGSAIGLILTDYINPNYAGCCWVYISPVQCGETLLSSQTPELEQILRTWCDAISPDVRGMNYYFIGFLVGHLWICLVLVLLLASMILIWWKVRTTQARSLDWASRWAEQPPPQRETTRARRITMSFGNNSLSQSSHTHDSLAGGTSTLTLTGEGNNQHRQRRRRRLNMNEYVVQKAQKIIAIFVVIYVPTILFALFHIFPYTIENIIVAILLPMQGILNALAYSDGFRGKVVSCPSGLCSWLSSWCRRKQPPTAPPDMNSKVDDSNGVSSIPPRDASSRAESFFDSSDSDYYDPSEERTSSRLPMNPKLDDSDGGSIPSRGTTSSLPDDSEEMASSSRIPMSPKLDDSNGGSIPSSRGTGSLPNTSNDESTSASLVEQQQVPWVHWLGSWNGASCGTHRKCYFFGKDCTGVLCVLYVKR